MVEQKTFQISPKSSREWLVAVSSWADYMDRVRVAEDMVTNARELEGGVDWGEILGRTFAIVDRSRRYTGKVAIVYSIAGTVGSVASNMGWNMHSPEIVYMSGYHFFWGLGKDIDNINKRLAVAEERTFDSQEAKEKTFQKEQQDVGRLGTFRQRLGESLDLYARQSFPAEDLDQYLEILRGLLYAGHNQLGQKRHSIFNFLKSGQIREAHATLTGNRNENLTEDV